MEPAELEPFTIFDAFADAWGSLRRRVWTHLGWNAIFVALLVTSTCALTCAMVPVMGVMGASMGDEGGVGGASVLFLVLYGAMLAVMLGMMALHQAVTLAITAADLRGEPIDLSTALRLGMARVAPMAGAMVLRLAADMVVWVVALGVAVSAMIGVIAEGGWTPETMRDAVGPALIAGFLLAYAVGLAWTLVVRAFLGLSGPCVQNEELGPLSAMARSVQLLSGRRLQHIGMRVAWALIALALYAVTYAPALLLLALPQILGEGGAIGSLLVLPYLLVWYFFALHLLTFDTMLEGAVHARVTRQRTAADLATVFA